MWLMIDMEPFKLLTSQTQEDGGGGGGGGLFPRGIWHHISFSASLILRSYLSSSLTGQPHGPF